MLYTLENVIKRRQQGAAGYCLHIRHLHIAEGEQIALTGLSGSGKSTALDLLGLVLEPDEAEKFLFLPDSSTQHEKAPDTGTVDAAALWRKKNLDAMATLRLNTMGYVLQTGGLLPFLTVAENMGLTARMQRQAAAAVQEAVQHLAERLGIAQLLNTLPALLSVGERQRVAIGRALVTAPKLVLADEPTAALDPIHAEKVMELFRNSVKMLGSTLVMVSHDLSLVRNAGLREVQLHISVDQDGAVLATIDDEEQSPCRAA